MDKIYFISNTDRTIITVGDYINSIYTPFHGTIKSAEEFLSYTSVDFTGNTISNLERLQNSFLSDLEKSNALDGKQQSDYPIKIGIKFAIPQNKVQDNTYLGFQGTPVTTLNEPAFKAAALVQLEANQEYKKVTDFSTNGIQSSLIEESSSWSVWIWCRSFQNTVSSLMQNPKVDLSQPLQGSLINVTPYVSICSTNQTKTSGGNFIIKMAPLTYIRDKTGAIRDLQRYQKDDNYTEASIVNEGTNQRSSFFFHECIGYNDMVFIKFETLSIEVNEKTGIQNRLSSVDKFFLHPNDLPNQVYDLIGFVDNCPIQVTPEGEVQIAITGRDFSKIFVEDGSYFFPQLMKGGTSYIGASNNNLDNLALLNRIVNPDKQFALVQHFNARIVQLFQFVITQLSNLTIAPDQLFSGYKKEDKDWILKETYQGHDSNHLTAVAAQGIWKLVNLVTDDAVDQRVLVDSSLSSYMGSLYVFLQKLCYPKFIEFFMDTYGDQYYITIRKPPFDRISYINTLNGVVKTTIGSTVVVDQSNNDIFTSFTQDAALSQQVGNLSASTVENLIIDIDEISVLEESLDWETEFYTWFHLQPKNSITGVEIYIPIIGLDQYAKVFGSKVLDVFHYYVGVNQKTTASTAFSINSAYEQGLQDLRFLVETHAYLPFTRKGVITLIGDRRLKVGNFIRYRPTNEIFHIDAVGQRGSITTEGITRETIITVSRGMIEPFINGVNIDGKNYSYFTIVNTNDIFEKGENKTVPVTNTTTTPVVIDTNLQKANTTSDSGKVFIQNLEQPGGEPALKAYKDGFNYAIGWGHNSSSIQASTVIDKNQALIYFNADTANAEGVVKRNFVSQNFSQNQFDSLVSWTYNTGGFTKFPTFKQSILNYFSGSLDLKGLGQVWTSKLGGTYTNGGLTFDQGLEIRRQKEFALFSGTTPTSQQTTNSTVLQTTQDVPTKKLKNGAFAVDVEVFNFFLNRSQMTYFKF